MLERESNAEHKRKGSERGHAHNWWHFLLAPLYLLG